MAEKLIPSIDRAPSANSDWPSLIERAVDDVSRILRSEAQIIQTNVCAALDLQIAKTITLLTIVAVIISGGLCILGAAIFLIHQWLPLWQSFGIAGLVMLLAGFAGIATLRPRTEAAPSAGLLNKQID
jgi:hypothetical protein